MVNVFLQGTQRGFAVGTCRGMVIIKEVYFRDNGTNESIDKAYKEASAYYNSLSQTIKRNPRLAKQRGWI